MSSWTEFASDVANAEVREQLASAKERIAMPPDAVARAIAFAIEQPPDVDEMIVGPTAQG
jgi:NADP-dependent 3-hydroxy acid dehydrogenase YdfG